MEHPYFYGIFNGKNRSISWRCWPTSRATWAGPTNGVSAAIS